MLERERCLRLACLVRMESCRSEWIGENREELWAICTVCGKRRVFMTYFREIPRIEKAADQGS